MATPLTLTSSTSPRATPTARPTREQQDQIATSRTGSNAVTALVIGLIALGLTYIVRRI
jgi:type IV secretory pathway VirB2 component (pilin)